MRNKRSFPPGGPVVDMLAKAASVFDENGAPYAVIGRIAVSAWAASVTTNDVDVILILPSGKGGKEIVSGLKRAGFCPSHEGPKGDFDLKVFTYDYGGREFLLDIFSGGHAYLAQVVRRARKVTGIPGLKRGVHIASPEDIIALKLLAATSDPRRETKDLMDCKELLERCPGLDRAYLEEVVRERNVTAAYRRVLKYVGKAWFST